MISIIKWVLTRVLDPIFDYFRKKKEQNKKYELNVHNFQSTPIEDTLDEEAKALGVLNTRVVTKIVLHCSDSDLSEHDNLFTIHKWHVAKGWKGCGYHYVIRQNGRVETGRTLEEIGAHARGFNKESVGICLTGKYNFSVAQFKSCNSVIRNLLEIYNLSWDDVFLHSDLNSNKTCPNFKLYQVKAISI